MIRKNRCDCSGDPHRENQSRESSTDDLAIPISSRNDNSESWIRECALLQHLRGNALALPEDLVRQFASAKSQSLGAWEEARASDDEAAQRW